MLGPWIPGAFPLRGNLMSLFIANTTKQDWNHHYRVLESNRPYYTRIPSGTQVELGRDWNPAQIDSVVKQLEKYGARAATEINSKLKQFPGLLYRIGKAITESQILSGHEAVVENQERRSADEATKAALGFDRANRDKRTNKRMAKVTEVEVHQDTPRNERPSKDAIHFKVGVAEDGRDSLKIS